MRKLATITINKTGLIKKKKSPKRAQSWGLVKFQVASPQWVNPPRPCLQSRALCGTIFELSIARVLCWIDPLLACWFYFILYYFVMFSFCILIHDYTLCFVGSPCCSLSYYNYISVWPYYIVSQSPLNVWYICDFCSHSGYVLSQLLSPLRVRFLVIFVP